MSKTVKVFFSQPMHGLSDDEIKRERNYMMSEFYDYITCVEHSVGYNYFKWKFVPHFSNDISDHIHDIFAGNLSHDS